MPNLLTLINSRNKVVDYNIFLVEFSTMKKSKTKKKQKETIKLSKQHEIFVAAYCEKLSMADAYMVAYPNASRQTARSNGYKLLKNPVIAEAIEKKFQERKQNFEINEKEIIQRLKSFIEVDPKEYYDSNYIAKNLDAIAPEKRKLIKQVKITNAGVSIELPDKVEALTKLGQQIGMFGSGNKLDQSKFLVRIFVVPPIDNTIKLPDVKEITKQLINDRLNGNGNAGEKH